MELLWFLPHCLAHAGIQYMITNEWINRMWSIPPQPEYFYQPTGNEKVPEIVGEEEGTVVYQVDSGIVITLNSE